MYLHIKKKKNSNELPSFCPIYLENQNFSVLIFTEIQDITFIFKNL